MPRPSNEKLIEQLQLGVRRSMMWTFLLHHTAADKVGLNTTDALCIALLALHGPQTPGRLAQLLGITAGGAITAVIDRLEEARLVRRTRDPGDGRRVIIEPMRDAARFATYFEPFGGTLAQQVADLPEKRLELLLDWLVQGNAVLTHAIAEIRGLPD